MNVLAEKLFGNWEETIIWSCLQGVMGDVYTNEPENDAAMAILGDFAFFAGKPCEKLLKQKPENCSQDFLIMVPQNDEWAMLIEKIYQEKAKKVTRYAFKKQADVFDKEKLKNAILQLPSGYELSLLEEKEFAMCRENRWSVALAEKLGYQFSHEYVAYEVMDCFNCRK